MAPSSRALAAATGPYTGWSPAWPRGARAWTAVSTADTVRAMEDAAKGDQWHPAVRRLAVSAYTSAGGRQGRPVDVLLAMERAVASAVAYVPDPVNVELVQWPSRLLAEPVPAGDCDDMDTLLACCLMAVGFDPSICRLAWDASGPDPYEHVVVRCEVDHDGGRVAAVMDPTWPGDLSALLRAVRAFHVHPPISRAAVVPSAWAA